MAPAPESRASPCPYRRVVRGWAVFDLLVTAAFVFPPIARGVIDAIVEVGYAINLSASPVPTIGDVGLIFASCTGVLGVIWAIVRLASPTRRYSTLDIAGRLWIGGVIVYFVLVQDAPGVLLVFALSEWVGGIHQALWLVRRSNAPIDDAR